MSPTKGKQRSKKKKPVKVMPPQRKKTNVGQTVAICPVLGSALYKTRGAPVELPLTKKEDVSDDKDPVFTDPNINTAVNQVLVRSDKAPFTLKAAACHTQSTYLSDETSGKVKRITWVIPEKVQNSTDGIVKMDRRGQIANIRSASVQFHNVSTSQTLQIRINTPLGVMDEGNSVSGNVIGTRKPNMLYTLAPGKKCSYNVNRFADKDNLFKPYIGPLKEGDDAWRGLVIADFCAIIPDVNEESGKDNSTEQQAMSILNVLARVKYLTIQDQNADNVTDKFEVRSVTEFRLQNLPSVAAMFHVDAHLIPVSNLGAMGLPYAIAPKLIQAERATHHYYRLCWVGLRAKGTKKESLFVVDPSTYDDDMALALMHCDSNGKVDGYVAFTSYESSDNRITMLSGGYCHYAWEDKNHFHRFVLNNLAYSRQYGAWVLVSGDNIFWSGQGGKVDNTPVINRECAFVVQSTNNPTLSRIGSFKVVPDLRSWIDDLGVALTVVSEVVGFMRVLASLF